MSVYEKKHYEDVAKLLAYHWDKVVDESPVPINSPARSIMGAVLLDFADLFAADNPGTCRFPNDDHRGDCDKAGGFDREQFLKACGLENEREC